MAVVGDADRRLGGARQIDRGRRLHAEAGLRAETAADMIGDDADLVVVELVALGDQLHQMEHALRRGVHGEAVAVEMRDRGMRLEAGMRLRAGAEHAFDQQRILRLARAFDPASHLLGLERERRRRSADVCLPRRRRAAAFGDVAGFLAVRLFEHDRRIRLAGFIEPDHRRQFFAGNLDRGNRRQRGLAIPGRDGGDGLADKADHAVFGEQRDRGADARQRQRGREIEVADFAMRDLRAQDDAFELAVMPDIDGVFRRARHLVARLDARRRRCRRRRTGRCRPRPPR